MSKYRWTIAYVILALAVIVALALETKNLNDHKRLTSREEQRLCQVEEHVVDAIAAHPGFANLRQEVIARARVNLICGDL